MAYKKTKLQWFNYFRNAMLACLGAALLGLFGCAANQPAQKEEADSLVWPSPPEQPRIRFLAEYSGQDDFGKGSLKSWLYEEQSGLHLKRPSGVAASADGNLIYVTDIKMHAVVVFDLNAKEVRILRDDLVSPTEIDLDKRGRVFVADSMRKEVLVFSPEGSPLMSLGKKEALDRPIGLAIDEAHNRLYVADTTRHRIVVYDLEGKHLFDFGERGEDLGQLNYPASLALDVRGNLLVVDSGNYRIQIFDMEGKHIRAFGQLGNFFGNFNRPKGIAVDSDNNIYVVDAAFNNFQIFNPEGRLLLFVGEMGRKPGMFWLPTGIYINRGDRIYVVDSINARIQIFQYLKDGMKAAVKITKVGYFDHSSAYHGRWTCNVLP
ncbi:MAG: hypothetical protein K2P67_01300 [Gallionellaceae bacterium]|nr:hypothetical protein [Gallionellaceae bacterium]